MMNEGNLFKKDPGEERAAIREVIEEVFSISNLLMRGLLSKKQAFQLSRAVALSDLWKAKYPRTSTLMLNICNTLIKTSISTNGESRGRNDLSQALMSVVSVSTTNKEMANDSRLFGGLGPKS